MNAAFFIEMAWKSALIAGAALFLAAALRSRSASDRATVLRVGVALLLLLPLIALCMPALEIVAWSAPELAPVAASAPLPELAMSHLVAELPPAETTIWDDPTPLILLAYLGGLLMAGSRLLVGLWTLHRWTGSAAEVACPEWRAAFERARWAASNGEEMRLLVSDSVPSPLSWGWRRPVILIDRDSLDAPEDADGILAHEVAHVARLDWPALMLSRVAAALFWFNPLVWLLEREVVQQAEEAADCNAIEAVEPARYAETLVSWARSSGGMIPAHRMTASGSALSRRVRAILDGSLRDRPAGSIWSAIAILMCIGIAAPVAAVELVEAAPEAPLLPAAPPAPPPAATLVAAAPAAPAPAALPPEPEPVIEVRAPALPPAPALAPAPARPASAGAAPTPAAPPVPAAPPAAKVAALAALAAAPATPVAPMTHKLGHPAPPATPMPPRPATPPRALADVDTLVAMRIHGVSASYIRDLASVGPRFRGLPIQQLVTMRIHGVSPDYVRTLARAGYADLSPNQIVTMRIHGVSARMIERAIEKIGQRPSPSRLVEFAIHGE